MKQATAAAILSLCTIGANAADITFNGNVNAACAFGTVTSGILNITGTAMTTTSVATFDVSTNGGNYDLVFPAVTTLAVAPSGSTLSGDLQQTPLYVSGASSANSWVGADATGYTFVLDEAGTHSISLGVAGTIDTPLAGAYEASVPATCTAQ
jgi:hypothetical protein